MNYLLDHKVGGGAGIQPKLLQEGVSDAYEIKTIIVPDKAIGAKDNIAEAVPFPLIHELVPEHLDAGDEIVDVADSIRNNGVD